MSSLASQLPPEVRLEYPFNGNTLALPSPDGGQPVRMHFIDEGTGPVVLLLHGNPTWSFYYRNLVNVLIAAGFRCIAPDHIGCGLSDKPQEYDYTLARRISDVECLVDHLGLESFSMVLHDWGGAIGCGLAVRRPQALDKLVLLNTAAFRSKRIPLRIAALRLPLIGKAIIRGINGFPGPAAVMAVKQPLAPPVRAGLLWPYRNWADRVAVWKFVRDIPMRRSHPSYATLVDIEKNLPALADHPVQLVWGGRDFCFNRHFLDRWQSIFPDAQVDLYPDHGHYVIEDGREDAIPSIAGFLGEG